VTILSTTKPVAATTVDATVLANNFTAIESVVNGNIDGSNFGAGKIFDVTKLLQGGATTGQALVWGGSAWGPGSAAGSTQTGEISMFGAKTPPAGFLMCDGVAQLRSTYAALFGVIVPNLGNPTISNASPGVVTLSSHGLVAGDTLFFTTTGGLPTGLSVNTIYYVIAAGLTSNAFEVSATHGGAAINTSSAGSGTHTLWHCPYGLGDGSTTFNMPDLRGRVAVGHSAGGAFEVAGLGANDTRAQSVRNISHAHTEVGVTTPASAGGGGSGAPVTNNTSGDANNMNYPAFQTVNYIIKT
jgi:microcystin-dependent protein